jgi:hypothetical protein
VNQMSNRLWNAGGNLAKLRDDAEEALRKNFKGRQVSWVPRNWNKEADALVNKAFGPKEELVLVTPTGEVRLGSADEARGAMADISELTGGSSGGGRWSRVFGVADCSPRVISAADLTLLAAEAADLRATLSEDLSSRSKVFLDRLASLG